MILTACSFTPKIPASNELISKHVQSSKIIIRFGNPILRYVPKSYHTYFSRNDTLLASFRSYYHLETTKFSVSTFKLVIRLAMPAPATPISKRFTNMCA